MTRKLGKQILDGDARIRIADRSNDLACGQDRPRQKRGSGRLAIDFEPRGLQIKKPVFGNVVAGIRCKLDAPIMGQGRVRDLDEKQCLAGMPVRIVPNVAVHDRNIGLRLRHIIKCDRLLSSNVKLRLECLTQCLLDQQHSRRVPAAGRTHLPELAVEQFDLVVGAESADLDNSVVVGTLSDRHRSYTPVSPCRPKRRLRGLVASIAACTLFCLTTASSAHNGSVVVALPVEGITIDGDLSDWPDLQRYPLRIAQKRNAPTMHDEAWFRVAWDDSALYIAGEILDDDLQLEQLGDNPWAVDGFYLIRDALHRRESTSASQYQYAESELRPLHAPSDAHDIVCRTSEHPGRRIYECRAAFATDSPAQRVEGFGFSISDLDTGSDVQLLAHGPLLSSESGTPGGISDLIFAKKAPLPVQATLSWPTGEPATRQWLRTTFADTSQWLVVRSDMEGTATLPLPVGDYTMATRGHRETVHIADVQTDLALDVAPAEVTRRALGPGKVQPAGAGRWDGSWQILGTGDGLPDPAITAVHQDRHGVLWLGTMGAGLDRYDGQTHRHYGTVDGLPGLNVWDIAEGPDGSLWLAMGGFASDYGLVRLLDDELTHFTMEHGLPTNTLEAVTVAPNGDVWTGGWGGLARLDGESVYAFEAEDGWVGGDVYHLLHDGARLWIGGGAGLFCYDGSEFLRVGDIGEVETIALDAEGTIWAGGTALIRVDDDLTVTAMPYPGHFVQGLVPTPDRLWIGTDAGIYSLTDGHLTAHEIWSGAQPVVRAMIADDDGDLWFGTGGFHWSVGGGGTSGSGMARLRVGEFESYTAEDGLARDESMTLEQRRDGSIWVGSWDGVSRFDGDRFHPVEGVRGNTFALHEDRQGQLWIPTHSTGDCGIYRVDDEEAHCLTHPNVDGREFIGVVEDHEGGLWFGGGGGLQRFDGHWTDVATQHTLPASFMVPYLVDDQGHVWLASGNRGVSRFDGETFVNYGADAGPLARQITNVLQDRHGRIWAGGVRGLSVYDGDHFVDLPEGLIPHAFVVHVLEDDAGILWISTWGGGIVRTDGEVYQTLQSADGLISDATQEVLQANDGTYWIATEDGVTHYTPRAGQPTLRLTNVIVQRELGPVDSVAISTAQERITFEFQGGSLRTRPGHMLYLYRLNANDEWQQTRDDQASFVGLPRGEYNFEVVAVDRDLNRSEPVTVHLTVTWPIERIAWATTLGIALLLVIGQSARVIRRDRRLIAANAELEAANQEITEATRNKSQFLRRMSHDLRSPMNAIIGYSRVVLRRSRDVLDQRQVRNLENIETSSGNLLNLINDILDLSRIEAGRVEISEQPVDLRKLADECADSLESIVKDDVVLERDLDDVGLINSDPDRLRQVVMNLLGNATKFTDSGSITLSLKQVAAGDPGKGVIELSVADTGIGIPAEDLPHIFDEFRQVERQGGEGAEGTGLGLAIAKKTVELLGGEISATSEVGVGTTFTVRMQAS
jgi:signal transduction histidine kinase/ligand-binding sensor domain-containing protein